MTPRLAHAVIKPELRCTGNCPTCLYRRTLYRSRMDAPPLSLSEWKFLIGDMEKMKVGKLTISGGEPTLYEHLLTVIEEGKKAGLEVRVNSNGSLIDRRLAENLLRTGLDYISLSLYSHDSAVHDRMRGRKGLWEKAVSAAGFFADLRDGSYPHFRLNMQTLISKDNYKGFPHLLELAYAKRFCNIIFSYLEGDYSEKKRLLNRGQLEEFKKTIIPESLRAANRNSSDGILTDSTWNSLKKIYPLGNNGTVTLSDYAKGKYHNLRPCIVPSYFTLILASGDVLPCPMVEYTHQPIMGNLKKQTLQEIWEGDKYETFRKNGFSLCRFCPVPLQLTIPVLRLPEFYRLRRWIPPPLLDLFLPRIKRCVFRRKNVLAFIRKR